jgi:flagellar biosynthesis protein
MSDGPKKVVALGYQADRDAAPRILAKGSGEMAERILQLAREHQIPLKEDPPLVEILSALDLHQEIPPELYQVVAEILAYVYRTTGRAGVGTTANQQRGD